ncbi:type 4a pilus biogenesis protein PilO [Candidatus Gottesmanbacteria bacterium]|nr:type 4a pilus biogenesis protein PilO [Candidatus Gottesmanbacteria bacterium]
MLRYVRRFLLIYQGFVLSGTVFVFCLLALVLAVIPGVRATRDLYDNLQMVRKEGEGLARKLTVLESIHEEDIKGQLLMMFTAVPQEKSVPTVISSVEGLALTAGVNLLDLSLISPGSLATGSANRQSLAEKKIGASGLPLTITVSGSYDQIRAFVSKINAIKRMFDVSSFDLSIGDSGQTQARVSLTAYYQPIPTKVGSIAGLLVPLNQKEEETLKTVAQYPDMTGVSSETLTPVSSGGKRDPFAR